jgi:hypothetical protein
MLCEFPKRIFVGQLVDVSCKLVYDRLVLVIAKSYKKTL